MRLFGKKKVAEAGSPPAHQRRVVGDDHKVTPLPAREFKRTEMSPEEKAAVAWRKQQDLAREAALAEGRGCGRCIDGKVPYQTSSETGLAACNCKFAQVDGN